MKILRFWNGRPQEYAQLQQQIKDLESVVAALASEVASARSSAASASQGIRMLLHKQDELEKEEERAAQPWRVLRLAALCVVLMLLAGLVTETGVRGFSNPPAVTAYGNSVTLAFLVPDAVPQQAKPSEPYPVAYIYPTFRQDLGYAEYEIIVPAQYAGWPYALMLTGTARIGQPAEVNNTPFQSRLTTCGASQDSPPLMSEECQLITGRIPSGPVANLPGAGANSCHEESPSPNKSPDAIALDFYGTPQVKIASDWAYQQYALPGTSLVDAQYSRFYGLYNEFGDISLGGFYEAAYAIGCRVDQMAENTDLTDISAPATRSAGGALFWNGPNIPGTVFVVRRRDAEEISDALLATGATVAALAVGFINSAFDANRDRRHARKRQRARQKAHPALVMRVRQHVAGATP